MFCNARKERDYVCMCYRTARCVRLIRVTSAVTHQPPLSSRFLHLHAPRAEGHDGRLGRSAPEGRRVSAGGRRVWPRVQRLYGRQTCSCEETQSCESAALRNHLSFTRRVDSFHVNERRL